MIYSNALFIAAAVDPQSFLNASRMEFYVDIVDIYLNSVISIFNIASTLAALLTYVATVLFLRNHKNQYEALRKGTDRRMYDYERSPSELLSGSFKYQAYQTAYMAWGFSLQVFKSW